MLRESGARKVYEKDPEKGHQGDVCVRKRGLQSTNKCDDEKYC